jgi:hypothetical protein
MPRAARVDAPGVLHHIIIRGIERRKIFRDAKNAGKVVFTGTRVISKDGKVMTISGKGTNAKGEPLEFIMVFDKR